MTSGLKIAYASSPSDLEQSGAQLSSNNNNIVMNVADNNQNNNDSTGEYMESSSDNNDVEGTPQDIILAVARYSVFAPTL
jgi:hypothetical protein